HFVQMDDFAFGVERGGDDALPAEDTIGTEAIVEGIEVTHAVEQRKDDAVGSDGGGERCDGIVEIVRFATEEDEIERLAEVFFENRRGPQRDIAERAADDQTGVCQFGGASRADEECNVSSGLQQSSAKISADRAGTDHQSSHLVTVTHEACTEAQSSDLC